MSRIVIDADAMIKLLKADVLGILLDSYEVLIPQAVYEEAVARGKAQMREDAFHLEALLRGRKVEMHPPAGTGSITLSSGLEPRFGAGERAALAVYVAYRADATLSDDRTFLRALQARAIPYLTPTAILVEAVLSGWLEREAGLAALERIRPHVRDDAYRKAREDLVAGETEHMGDT